MGFGLAAGTGQFELEGFPVGKGEPVSGGEHGVWEPLAGQGGEVVAEPEEELGQVWDECILEVGLGVLVLQAEELEDVGLFDGVFRADAIRRGGLGTALESICRPSCWTVQPLRSASVS